MVSAPRPEVLAFLEDIKSHPEDDVPRLILADWLAERGDPRGEFLHVQCRLAASEWGDPHGDALARRQRELLTAHATTWTGPLEPHILDRHFRRGLLRVNVYADRLVEAGRAGLGATEAWSWVEVLTLREARVDVDDLVACDLLAAPGTLYLIHNGVGYLGASALAESPHLARLVEWHLPGAGIGSEGLAALARSPHLSGLRHLYLRFNSIGDDGVEALAASPLLAQLTVLDLSGNLIGDRGVRALAESPYLPDNLQLMLHRATISPALAAAVRERLGGRVSV